jgi:hypothetical protein
VFILHAACGEDNYDGGRGSDDNDDGYFRTIIEIFHAFCPRMIR